MTEPVTQASLIDLMLDLHEKSLAMPPNTIYVSIPMANRMDRVLRRYEAFKALGIDPESAKARKVTARGNRWPE